MLEVKTVGTVSFASNQRFLVENIDCAMEQIEAIILGHADPVEVA